MPGKNYHVLFSLQPLLDLVNTPLDSRNMYSLLSPNVPLEAIKRNHTFADQHFPFGIEAARQLQRCLRGVLDRFFEKNKDQEEFQSQVEKKKKEEPLEKSQFKIAGREPFGLVGRQPINYRMSEEFGLIPPCNDFQDYRYLQIAALIRLHTRYADLPPDKRFMGWTDKIPPPGFKKNAPLNGIKNKKEAPRPYPFLVQFYPLVRCAAPRCNRYFFRKRTGDKTCGRKCAQARYYQEKPTHL